MSHPTDFVRERYIPRAVLANPDFFFPQLSAPPLVRWTKTKTLPGNDCVRLVGIDSNGDYWTTLADADGEPDFSNSDFLLHESNIMVIFDEDVFAIRANIQPGWNPPRGMYTCPLAEW